MSTGLEAIVNELKRLQRDGVDRVFVEDATMSLIASSTSSTSPTSSTSSASSTEQATNKQTSPHPPQRPATVEQIGDLREMIKEGTTDAGKVPSPPSQSPKAQETPNFPPPPKIELPAGDAITQLAWLKEQVLSCEVCQQHLGKHSKIVFGNGSPEADILFCGEAPGTEEEKTGEAFIGKSGQLLTKIITAMGLSRESVYLTSVLKWRPEHDKPYGNRPPTLEEMRFCLPYLQAQVKIIQPKVIVALGSSAVTGLLGPDPKRKLGSVRGTWASFDEIPVMITFHPSYLLRNGTLKTKRMAWEDMLKVMEKCALEISDKQRGFFLPKN
jgi:DNA polymerase